MVGGTPITGHLNTFCTGDSTIQKKELTCCSLIQEMRCHAHLVIRYTLWDTPQFHLKNLADNASGTQCILHLSFPVLHQPSLGAGNLGI